MKSVKQLETMSLQEVFDKVKTHLLKQGVQCQTVDGDCMYRHKVDGKILKCAVGCLIPKREYKPGIEHNDAPEAMEMLGVELSVEMGDMLDDLRDVHDHYLPKKWATELRKVAKKYGLKWESK